MFTVTVAGREIQVLSATLLTRISCGPAATVLNVTEAGCKGVAMLAKAAHTKQPVTEIAAQWTKVMAKIIPDQSHSYDQQFRSYKELYPALGLAGRFF